MYTKVIKKEEQFRRSKERMLILKSGVENIIVSERELRDRSPAFCGGLGGEHEEESGFWRAWP